MEPTLELSVAEYLASRLCHDLVSPVGAVKSGIELFTEFDEDPDGETMALITTSAEQASQKLQFFRLAYGNAGVTASGVAWADTFALITTACLNQRSTLEASDPGGALAPPPGAIKLLLNAAMVAGDSLPRGGVLRASITQGGDGGVTVQVSAQGEGARLEEGLEPALAGNLPSELSPRSAHAYFTALVAQRAGAGFDVTTGSDEVTLTFGVPAG